MDRSQISTVLVLTNMRRVAILLQGRAWLTVMVIPLLLCAAIVAKSAWAERRSAWVPSGDPEKSTSSDDFSLPAATGIERLPATDDEELSKPELNFAPPAAPSNDVPRSGLYLPQTVRDDWQKDAPKPTPRLQPKSEPPVEPSKEPKPEPSPPSKPEPLPSIEDEAPAVPTFADNALDARLLDGGPWWSAVVSQPMRSGEQPRPIALPDVVLAALFHSEYVRGLSLQPQIQETDITKYQAEFDPTAFLESKWQDLNDPVGNTLTTGGANRFLDSNLANRAGIRRKTTTGGVLELEQNVGLRDTNSVFFVPGNQALTQLAINYNQPLLRGAGQCYNQSLIVMAEIDTRQSHREVQRLLQDHVLKVIQSYWELSLQRSLYVQRQRARERALEIQRELEARKDWDVVQSQLLRARAAIALRTAAIARADAAIRNAETRLRVLTNAPELSSQQGLELLPVEPPPFQFQPPSLTTEMQIALTHRPEVDVALERIKASEVRLGMANHELRPSLNLVLQGYAKGLQGNYGVLQSLGDQFTVGGPSYTTGLVFEAPLGNRAAQAKMRRRTLEVQQLMHEFQNTLANVSGDVEIAIREVEAAYQEFLSQQRAVLATDAEVNFLLQRWRLVPGHDRSAALLLEDALNAQDRLVAAEATLAQTQRDFAVSIATLRRNTGTLLESQQVGSVRRPATTPDSSAQPPTVPVKTVQLAPIPSQRPTPSYSTNTPPQTPAAAPRVAQPVPSVATRPANGRPSSLANPTPIAMPR